MEALDANIVPGASNITQIKFLRILLEVNNMEPLINFSSCKEVFEKLGERRLIGRGEYFVRSGEVLEYAGWIVSGGFTLHQNAD